MKISIELNLKPGATKKETYYEASRILSDLSDGIVSCLGPEFGLSLLECISIMHIQNHSVASALSDKELYETPDGECISMIRRYFDGVSDSSVDMFNDILVNKS